MKFGMPWNWTCLRQSLFHMLDKSCSRNIPNSRDIFYLLLLCHGWNMCKIKFEIEVALWFIVNQTFIFLSETNRSLNFQHDIQPFRMMNVIENHWIEIAYQSVKDRRTFHWIFPCEENIIKNSWPKFFINVAIRTNSLVH